ncbi:MAG: hypothetical protein Q9194_006251 [Teloschistes cf. exilis]
MHQIEKKQFRVVIVGAGVSGLVLAHALELAKIDFILLEKGMVAPPWGTSITSKDTWPALGSSDTSPVVPAGARLLHQIGILEAVERKCTPMKNFCCRLPDTGRTVLEDRWFDAMREKLGYPDLTLERREYLQVLYDELPNKSKVLTGKRVKNVVDNEEEAFVELDGGSVERGDLIVGCDGVHSTVRKAMWEIANQTIPNFITPQEKQTMVTTYSCLLGIAPQQAGTGFNEQDMIFVSNQGYTFQFLTQPDKIYFMIHHKLPEPVRWPNRIRYSEKDAEELAAKFAEHPIGDSLVFGDLWCNRIRGHLISLEEGVLEHFFFGRTVLIGDAAHKVTPNAAMGGASAMEDSIALANTIHKLAQQKQSSPHPPPTEYLTAKNPPYNDNNNNIKPSKQDVALALQSYQNERKPRLQKIHDESAFVTRLQSYDTWFLYLLMRWVLPLIGLAPIVHNVSKLGAGGPRLEYVDVEEESGTIPWVHPMPKKSKGVAA